MNAHSCPVEYPLRTCFPRRPEVEWVKHVAQMRLSRRPSFAILKTMLDVGMEIHLASSPSSSDPLQADDEKTQEHLEDVYSMWKTIANALKAEEIVSLSLEYRHVQ